MKFRFTTLLTALHYIITLLGLEVLAAFGVYEVVKLLVTPSIVALELYLYQQKMSMARALALLAICVGVAVAVVNDVSVNSAGLSAALLWVPIASLYKVLWSRETKENKWHTFALMRRVLPLSTVLLLVLVPLADPPGLFEFEWTWQRAALVALSGVSAFFVNWSGFLVMGACSALSHSILGQLKAVVIILGGWTIFAHAYPPKALAGAAVAFFAIVAYTRANLNEQQKRNKLEESHSDAEDPLVEPAQPRA